MAYVIRRYPNRKLYDVQARRYVTLGDLEKLIRAGRELSVVDSTTGADITAVMLMQVILERERHGQAALPAAFLHQLIKSGGVWQDVMAKGLQSTLEGLVSSQREADRIFKAWATRTGLVPSGERPASTAEGDTPAEERGNLRDEIAALSKNLRRLEEKLRRGTPKKRPARTRRRKVRRAG